MFHEQDGMAVQIQLRRLLLAAFQRMVSGFTRVYYSKYFCHWVLPITNHDVSLVPDTDSWIDLCQVNSVHDCKDEVVFVDHDHCGLAVRGG